MHEHEVRAGAEWASGGVCPAEGSSWVLTVGALEDREVLGWDGTEDLVCQAITSQRTVTSPRTPRREAVGCSREKVAQGPHGAAAAGQASCH